MSDVLVWERDPILDTYTAKVGNNKFVSMRTWCDVAVLYKDGIEIRRDATSGGHIKNMEYVEEWARFHPEPITSIRPEARPAR